MKLWCRRGFTYVEFVIGITLASLAILLILKVALLTVDLKHIETLTRELRGETSEACFRFAREVRTMRGRQDLSVASSTEVRFIDVNGNDIRYWLSGTELSRNNDALVSDVSSLVFTYYDETGALIGSPIVSPSETNVRSIRMAITVTKDGEQFSLLREANLRNLN